MKSYLPDGAKTEMKYGFGEDRQGRKMFETITIDPNGIRTAQYTDIRERVTAVKNVTSEGSVWTSFEYNAMNEKIASMDDRENKTLYEYDWFGRRISRDHPDAGLTTFSYDIASNLRETVTANLRESGGAVTYEYDYNRLEKIIYPENPENNVTYTFGEAGADNNRAGRVVLQEDASGAQEFFYGPLGEVIKNIRTVIIPGHTEQTYVTEWEYDTWNRLMSMTYPDGEKVEYTYNAGGLLRSMKGKKQGYKFNYVEQLGYDKFGQRVFLEYGYGTKTTYSYEEDRRRLKNMNAKTSQGRDMMDNVYEYDKVNNILSLTNRAAVPSNDLMGGSSTYSYEYDDLYRLVSAEGNYTGSNEKHRYNLEMEYNTVGGILRKNQTHERSGGEGNNWVTQKRTSYDMTYEYGKEQPNAPVHIGDKSYQYDLNGNLTGWTHDVSGQRRNIVWDEENRIRSIMDNGAIHHYVYDASGTRVLKGKSQGQAVYKDGSHRSGSGNMEDRT
ncbi:RHS repeat domain-containing protein [Marinigracilibium pacificum]|uniref:RHS repeat protein n=1 Tax=Marinigracilibium pacificum TaxID=2729599 RepID=A0A848IYD9_9BACT|nr:RHS repeat protein [Marinigracilibium pacificum]NMM48341.1 RHS repeat protein [Marinigracilibium pacificum]